MSRSAIRCPYIYVTYILPQEQQETREHGDTPKHKEGSGFVGVDVPLHQVLKIIHVTLIDRRETWTHRRERKKERK